MDTEKQRQRRRNNMRLTESGNARSEQLLVVPTESLTNREWLPRELLSGLEHQRPGWFLDMKYPTCYWLWSPGSEVTLAVPHSNFSTAYLTFEPVGKSLSSLSSKVKYLCD